MAGTGNDDFSDTDNRAIREWTATNNRKASAASGCAEFFCFASSQFWLINARTRYENDSRFARGLLGGPGCRFGPGGELAAVARAVSQRFDH
jgi:hypothetical protein